MVGLLINGACGPEGNRESQLGYEIVRKHLNKVREQRDCQSRPSTLDFNPLPVKHFLSTTKVRIRVLTYFVLQPLELRNRCTQWFEDVWDPLDYETRRKLAASYRPRSRPAAIFSASDAHNLLRYAGLRKGHHVLTFDPAHCYDIPRICAHHRNL
jgi:hypothetical protein